MADSLPVYEQALVTGLLVGGVYGLVAMGLALIFGVLGIINFAHGALMALAMYLAYSLVAHFHFDPYLTILVAVPALFLLGVAIQLLLVGPVLGGASESQLLLTLGIAIVIENLLLAVFTGTPRSVSVGWIGHQIPSGIHLGSAVASTQLVIAFAGSLALGGLVIGMLASFSDGYFETKWTQVVIFGILILVLVFRPTGLLGTAVPEK
jgi:branched-chain amino acid transport system permease protein